MTLHAAWKMDTEGARRRAQEIALIKFYGAQVLHDVVDRALQVHGSLGYSTDLPLEQMYRFARAARIYDGPDEVHRQTVARQILRGYEAPPDGVPTRARADAPRGRARAVRRPARGGDLERLSDAASLAVLSRRARRRAARARRRRRDRRVRRRRRRRGDAAAAREGRPLRRAARAFADLRHQVELGPRPAGSTTARELAAWLRDAAAARALRARARRRCATSSGAIPGRGQADRRRRPLRHQGHPRLRRRQRRRGRHRGGGRDRPRAAARQAPGDAPPIRFVLFDGEESPDDRSDFYATRPARLASPYARATRSELRAMVLLDYVAEKGACGSRARRRRTSSCGRGCARRRARWAPAGVPRRTSRRRSSTTTRRSCAAASPPST